MAQEIIFTARQAGKMTEVVKWLAEDESRKLLVVSEDRRDEVLKRYPIHDYQVVTAPILIEQELADLRAENERLAKIIRKAQRIGPSLRPIPSALLAILGEIESEADDE